MKIHVRLRGSLHIDLRMDSGTIELAVKEGAKVGEVIRELGLPLEEVWLVTVNGVKVSADYTLQNDDAIEIFPPVAGG